MEQIKDCNILNKNTWRIIFSYLHKDDLFDGNVYDDSCLYEMVLSNKIEILKCIYIKNNFTMSGLYHKLKKCICIFDIYNLDEYLDKDNMEVFKTWLLLDTEFNLTKREFDILKSNDISSFFILKENKITNDIFFNIVKKNEEMYMYMYECLILYFTRPGCKEEWVTKSNIGLLEYLLKNIFNINDDIDKKIYKKLILKNKIAIYAKDTHSIGGTNILIKVLNKYKKYINI
jgi:hypothetical protein